MIEGDETVFLELIYPDACGDDVVLFVEFIIFDVSPLVVTVPDVDAHCAGDEVVLSAIVTGWSKSIFIPLGNRRNFCRHYW